MFFMIRGNLVYEHVTLDNQTLKGEVHWPVSFPLHFAAMHKLNLEMKFWELPAVRMDEVTKEWRAGG